MSKWQKGTLKQIQNGLFLHYGDSEETQFPIKSKQIKKGFPAVVAELGGKAEMVVYFRAEGELLKELVTKAPEGFSEPVAQETPPPQPETESIAPVISEVELFTPDEIGVGEELLNFSPPPVNLAKSRGNGEEGGFSPYNFVSLPPGPVLTRLQSDRPTYSGRLEAKMVNKEPMFIRDGRLGEEGAEVFFNLGNPDQPAIPSTSLKGVLRSVLEAVCGSGYERVEDRYFFLRDIRSRQYTSMFIDAPNSEYLMQAGFLRKVDGRYYLQPAQWGKVSINDLHRNLTGKGAGVPPYNIRTSRIDEFMAKSPQGKRVRANFKAYYNMEIGFSASVSQSMQVPNSPFRLNYNQIQGIGYSGSKKGRLVLTGPMNHKSNEFVFYDAEPNIARWIPVQRSVIDTFARDTSDFQEEMFGTGLNIDNNGVPLFWLPADRRKESVYFFGRPTMFRIPYPYKLKAYVPKRFKGDAGQTFESLCLADKLLGTLDINADKDAKRGSIGLRGRVQVSPGTYQGRRDKPQDPKSLVKKKPEFLWDSPRELPPLIEPKPSSYQLYLDQSKDKKLADYFVNPAERNIAGRKFYWHKPCENLEAANKNEVAANQNTDILTKANPLTPGHQFGFSIDFQGLSKVELGALLWALKPWPESAWKIGAGKPYGMGSTKIEDIQLEAEEDDSQRYESILPISGKNVKDEDFRESCITAFKTEAAQQWQKPDKDFDKFEHVRDLKAMLDYSKAILFSHKDPKNPDRKRYMGLQERDNPNERATLWNKRVILPKARDFYGS